MKKLFLLWLFCGIYQTVVAQNRVTISGYVTEKGSAENLPQVTIYAPSLQLGTTTNNYGFYSLTLPASASVELQYTFIGYKTVKKTIVLDKDQTISVELETESNELNEVVLEAQEEKVSETPQMSVVSLPIQQIKEIPALFGEKDVLKVLQLMPGVKSGGEGTSGLYVRGGGPDQNLIILDDAIVYNASHLFGFFSLFNGNALKSVELTKGGFPARYGGRLSSVVDMTMKDGHKEEFHGEASIGLISSSATIEGPIKKGKSSFLVSGRRTYLDLLVKPFLPKDQKAGYYFYDLNAKVNYAFSPKDRVYLSGYFGQDKFSFSDKSQADYQTKVGLYWGNATSTLRWNHLFNDKIFSNLSLIYSHYNFIINALEQDSEDKFELKYISRIRDFGAKYDVDFAPSPKHNLKMGALLLTHRFTPSAVVLRDDYSGTNLNTRRATDVLEGGVYVEDVFRPTTRLSANVGFRLSYFGYKTTHYVYPEPRASLAYRISEGLAVKASYAVMNQYLHLLSNTGAGLPTDLWVQSTDRVKPQQSQQVAIGIAKDFT
ncbi:MAG: TonB-dependent receptor, partial [Bacteroidetes bacterium]